MLVLGSIYLYINQEKTSSQRKLRSHMFFPYGFLSEDRWSLCNWHTFRLHEAGLATWSAAQAANG